MSKQGDIGRLDFLNRMVKLGTVGTIASFIPNAVISTPLAAQSTNQNEWRFCRKCRALFYNGYRNKGRCPASTDHVYDKDSAVNAEDYALIYNSAGPGQHDWRFCNKCQALFFDGYPQKGVCAAGGGHVAAGYNFTLRYDVGAPGEKDWRFCNKCEVLFFNNRYETNAYQKKFCAAGGVHVAAGYNFVLCPKGYKVNTY
jgi:hypothetical protein